MPKNTNSASRLVNLLSNIPGHPDNTQTLEVWANVFAIEEPNPNKKSAAVAELLNAMYRELEVIRKQMAAGDFSESLFAPSMMRMEHALSSLLLPGAWVQARQHLTAETLLALAFCGEILPDEESVIEPSEIAEIKFQVDELQALLTQSTLPIRLRVLVEHHIALIRRALAEYPIVGAKALREAAHTAYGELAEAQDAVTANKDAPEISKLGSVWKKVNDATDLALKAEKLSQLAHKIWDVLGNI